MACKIIMMEVAKSGAIHVSESCLTPSLGWPNPTKISSSTDFDAPQAQEASYETISKERSNDRDSLSEFEFAMSTIKHENVHGEHMLAADELFFKGKLLPLYNADFTDGSEQQVTGCITRDESNHQILSNHPASSCTLYIANTENSHTSTRDSTAPMSPKAPKCSIRLRELFGLKKMAKSISTRTASGEVAKGPPCKSSRCGSKKGKSVKIKQKASLVLQANSLPVLCKARHLSCASRDGDCIAAQPRNSASEPLLTCRIGQLRCPESSFSEGYQGDRPHYEHLEKDSTARSPANKDAVDIDCMHRSNRVCDSSCTHQDSHDQSLFGILSDEENQCKRLTGEQGAGSRLQSLQMGLDGTSMEKNSGGASNCNEKGCLGLPRAHSRVSGSRGMGMQLGEMSYEEETCRTVRRSMQMCADRSIPLHSLPSYEGSNCGGLPGEQNRGSRKSPMQVDCESSRGGTTRRPPMRMHIGETNPEISSGSITAIQLRYATRETLKTTAISSGITLNASASLYATGVTLKTTEISQTKSSERSRSYSPKSLQRKHEQLKAIRQREGWRMLERSSSYNSGMHSMRVAPVLNVPIVCMSRSKSSNHGMHSRRKA